MEGDGLVRVIGPAGGSTRHSSRALSYSTAVNARPEVVAVAGNSNESLAMPFALERTSAAASGDQPSGRSPASDCEPTDVTLIVGPAGTAPASTVRVAF